MRAQQRRLLERKQRLEDRIMALHKQWAKSIADRRYMNNVMGCDSDEEEEAGESYLMRIG